MSGQIPSDLKYTSDHEWTRLEGDLVRIGITDFAQEQLGDVVYVDLPAPGAEVSAGQALGEVESHKSVSDLFAPVSGTVTAVNDALNGEPGMVNADPEAGGWMFKIEVSDAGELDKLLDADGYLFCAPENLAAIAGVMKDFFDRSYYPVLGRIEGRPYGQMVCAGSDGENAVRQTARIAQGWRLKPVQEAIIVCTHAQTPEAILAEKVIPEDDLARCRDLGAALAAGLSMGVF